MIVLHILVRLLALCELIRDIHLVPSPSCVAGDSALGEGFQVCLDRGCPRLQMDSSSCEAVRAEGGP